MTTKNDTKYKWNIDKLKAVYDRLLAKDLTLDEEKELQLLHCFLNCRDGIEGFNFDTKTKFSDVFREEFRTLFMDYYPFLPYIFDFYDQANPSLLELPMRTLDVSDDELLAHTHDFFKSLDDEWFSYFMTIYKQRYDFLSFDQDSSFSAFLPNQGIWVASIARDNTVADYINCIHEYAHGIADQIQPQIKIYSPDNILIELFPIVCSLLFADLESVENLKSEMSKYLNNYFKMMVSFAEEVIVKFNIAETFCSVRNARCLIRLVRRTWGANMKREEAQALYSRPIESNINAVFPFIIALELVEIYYQDKDKFIHTMNGILRAEDDPLETLKRLELTPNSVFHTD